MCARAGPEKEKTGCCCPLGFDFNYRAAAASKREGRAIVMFVNDDAAPVHYSGGGFCVFCAPVNHKQRQTKRTDRDRARDAIANRIGGEFIPCAVARWRGGVGSAVIRCCLRGLKRSDGWKRDASEGLGPCTPLNSGRKRVPLKMIFQRVYDQNYLLQSFDV